MNHLLPLTLVISAVVIGWLTVETDAVPPISDEDLFDMHEVILVGEIVSRSEGPGPDLYYYDVKVEWYPKNSNSSSIFKFAGPKEASLLGGIEVFEIGDRVRLYLNKVEGVYVASSYSYKLVQPSSLSPLKQYQIGISQYEVKCKDNLQLVIKYNGSPACVKPETKQKLIERGWASYEKLETSGPAYVAAQRFIEKSPTFVFDGIEVNILNSSSDSEVSESPPIYTISAEFATRHPGYGNRTGQQLEESVTWHKAVIKVKGIEIISAVYDDIWDELHQKTAKATIEHDPKYTDCPVSFMTTGPSYRIDKQPPPLQFTILGKTVSSFEEAKKLTGMNELQLPKYVPQCLFLEAIYAKNQPDQNQITVLYLLQDTNISDIRYVEDAQANGLVISYQEDKDVLSFDWAEYVAGLEAEAPNRWSSIKIEDATTLLIERNLFSLDPTVARTIIGDKRIDLVSKILETDEMEKIVSSMFDQTMNYGPLSAPAAPILDIIAGESVSDVRTASLKIGYEIKEPAYLPEGYSVQVLNADEMIKVSTILASKKPVTSQTSVDEFFESQGILIFTEENPQGFDDEIWLSGWVEDNDAQIVSINGIKGAVHGIVTGTSFSGEIVSAPAELVFIRDNVLFEIRAMLPVDELIRIAEYLQ
jgi:hypothetical protein